MEFDELDIKMLKENVDDESLALIDTLNVSKIIAYLKNNNVYYYKDLFITFFDLFLLDANVFEEKFENLKATLGPNYVDKLGDDFSLIELMYK